MRETAHRNPHRKSCPPVVRLQGMNNCRAEPAVATIAVRSLTGTRVKTLKNQWRARVAVELRDVKAGAAIANVTVSGSFSPGGSASCVTATTGSCTVEGGNISDGTTARRPRSTRSAPHRRRTWHTTAQSIAEASASASALASASASARRKSVASCRTFLRRATVWSSILSSLDCLRACSCSAS